MTTDLIDGITVETYDSKQEASAATQKAISNAVRLNPAGLLLLSGGSSAGVAIESVADVDTSQYVISQIDERYGNPRHDDSNWKLLLDSGLDVSQFTEAYEVLALESTDLESSAAAFSTLVEELVTTAPYSLGVLGMGADGHISGMLPNTEANFARFMNDEYAVGYTGPDFERLTTTVNAIQSLNEIILFATGDEKSSQIEKLKSEHSLHEQPAQMLKNCKKVTIIYGKG